MLDFVVIQTRVSILFLDRTQTNQAIDVNTAAGDGRSAARPSPCLKNRMEP
jgi:hypothetical protein